MGAGRARHAAAPTRTSRPPAPRPQRAYPLWTGAEWAFVRQHEAEIVEYLKVSDSGGQGSAP